MPQGIGGGRGIQGKTGLFGIETETRPPAGADFRVITPVFIIHGIRFIFKGFAYGIIKTEQRLRDQRLKRFSVAGQIIFQPHNQLFGDTFRYRGDKP